MTAKPCQVNRPGGDHGSWLCDRGRPRCSAGLAPAPFAGLILQDFGANVIRIDRPMYANTDCLHRYDRHSSSRACTHGPPAWPRHPTPPSHAPCCVCASGKRSVAINLKKPEGVALVKELASKADVLIEPFRPGVMEKLGLGPDVLLEVNPRLVFARMTGWGQTGSYAKTAGHDINYIALSGALSVRSPRRPRPPAHATTPSHACALAQPAAPESSTLPRPVSHSHCVALCMPGHMYKQLFGRKHENPAFPINILGGYRTPTLPTL